MLLTPKQEHVLILIAKGRTVTDAAREAGITRNTVLHWRRTSPEFREYFAVALYKQAMHLREQLQGLGEHAVSTLGRILSNPDEPAGLRLNAALAVLDKLTQPLPVPPEILSGRDAGVNIENELDEEIEIISLNP